MPVTLPDPGPWASLFLPLLSQKDMWLHQGLVPHIPSVLVIYSYVTTSL